MAANRLSGPRQVILLCALALCVVAMHHVSTAKDAHGGVMAQAVATEQVVTAGMDTVSGDHDPGMPDGAHDLLHLCLAVMCAIVAFLLTFLTRSRLSAAHMSAVASPRGSPAPDRPPDRRGRVILTSLCVLRT